nr:glycosyltransferase [Chryseosolibacter indicus]
MWICTVGNEESINKINVPSKFLGQEMKSSEALVVLIKQSSFDIDSTLIVTHGCWGMPTKLGLHLKRLGFKWIYSPHGMLEPWSLKQKWLKKWIYFNLFERKWLGKADCIRAVSRREAGNLKKLFSSAINVIENGVEVAPLEDKSTDEELYLFMARLHQKKGILPLAQAWDKMMQGVHGKKLIIAGPDEGELIKIRPYLKGNVEYIGPVYGDEKINLLKRAHYYILPSYSEGFPTSVVEAMSYGLIPIISEGCNFETVFNENLGYKVEPSLDSIKSVLKELKDKKFDKGLSFRNWQFVSNCNSEASIAEKLFKLYVDIVGSK